MLASDPEDAVAAAQARRDRHRLAAAQAEIIALRHRVAKLERITFHRTLEPVRRALHVVAPAIKASSRLFRSVPRAPVRPEQAPSRGLALVVDNNWPQPDRDAGSMAIVTLLHALRSLGFEVIMAAAHQHQGVQPARDQLTAQGIRCLQPAEATSVEQFISQQGAELDLCVLCRVFCGGQFLELVQQHCFKARLIFDSIDLNFLREERKARLLNDEALLAVIDQVKAREEHVIRSCDATMVVSQTELELLAQMTPECLAVHMPLAHTLQPPVTRFSGRRNIGFIGSFAHAPNVDAVRFFLAEIWPMVRCQLPDCTLDIVGADAPDDLVDAHDVSVRLMGHVPDIRPWFESLRLTVAPLRFGAGAKGKVASSLAAGVPCIATPVAAEGMSLTYETGVLVAANAAEFAAAVVEAYASEALWARLSTGGLAYAERSLSPAAWQEKLDTMLRRIGM